VKNLDFYVKYPRTPSSKYRGPRLQFVIAFRSSDQINRITLFNTSMYNSYVPVIVPVIAGAKVEVDCLQIGLFGSTQN
jgi:hypothetical protein